MIINENLPYSEKYLQLGPSKLNFIDKVTREKLVRILQEHNSDLLKHKET